eukprot:gb/GEZN01005173.1/.p1 GENE.gb/GEZN01005173.1/~~gb/GEZN01005173.1/.p1  ORF type:complete len:504 (-),score=47.06 gb/GEZN01005173.1/:220-1731(-)
MLSAFLHLLLHTVWGAPGGLNPSRYAAVNTWLDAQYTQGLLPGGAMQVNRNGDQYLHYFGSGKPDTLYRMYSQTKVVTAVSMLMLYEQGKFILPDPVGVYLPDFLINRPVIRAVACNTTTEVLVVENITMVNGDVLCYVLEPSIRMLTIQDVLTFRAGWGYGDFSGSVENQIQSQLMMRYGVSTGADFVRSSTVVVEGCTASLAEQYRSECVSSFGDVNIYTNQVFAKNLAKVPLNAQPGVEWMYGVEGELVGRLIEVLSGKTLETFMATHIFDPLGMREIFFFSSSTDPKHAQRQANYMPVQSWTLSGGLSTTLPFPYSNLTPFEGAQSFQEGGGGLTSSLSDWSAFADALRQNYLGYPSRGGVYLLSGATLQYATQFFSDQDISWPGEAWGLCMATSQGAPLPQWPTRSFGWSGYASTSFRVIPEQNTYFEVMTAVIGSSGNEFLFKSGTVAASLLEGPFGTVVSVSPASLSPSILSPCLFLCMTSFLALSFSGLFTLGLL